MPTFTWDTLAWATMYRIQIDDDAAFGSPAVDAVGQRHDLHPARAAGGWCVLLARVRAGRGQPSGRVE